LYEEAALRKEKREKAEKQRIEEKLKKEMEGCIFKPTVKTNM